MLITCPNCQTHYSVSAQDMGKARDVRCYNCANTWRQAPVPERPRPRPAYGAPPAAAPWLGQPQAAMPPPPPYGYPPHPQAAPPPPYGYPPHPQAAPPPPPYGYPPHPQTAPPPAPAPEPAQPQGVFDTDNLIAELRQEAEDMPSDGPSDEPSDGPGASDAPADDLSDEDLEDIFDEEEFEPIASVVEPEGEADDFEDPDDIPDPEDDDLPVSLTADLNANDDEPAKKKGGALKWVLLGVLVLIAAAGGGGFFMKSTLTAMFPGMRAVYEAVGMGEKIEDIFKFGPITPDRVTETGVDYLIIGGSVENISKSMRTTPRVRVHLMNTDGDILQFTDVDPEPAELQSGETAAFEARIKEPSPLASRMEATFIDRMDAQ